VISTFADTSYFIALLDSDDDFHRAAADFSQEEHRPLVTTSAVILELGAYYHEAPDHGCFLGILEILQRSGAQIVHVDEALQERSIELFAQRPDKNWSLTDCISFLVMKDRAITEAATTDRHFEEAGYTTLLRRSPRK
jgi:predicted nucleic acid-binding protein